MLSEPSIQAELAALVSERFRLGRFVYQSDITVSVDGGLCAFRVRDRLWDSHQHVSSLHRAEGAWIHR